MQIRDNPIRVFRFGGYKFSVLALPLYLAHVNKDS